MDKKYNIGLDIGTTSVGWAVVEEDTQKIIRKGKGKDRKALWGVRLFEEANTAAGRRGFRSSRRRYDRRRERIRLLQDEFRDEINNVDMNFFKKLSESKYNKNDKINKTIDISKEENKLIREYNKKYPTIYHLRKELIDNSDKKDIRLVYLAIHHILKYRGNFLYGSDNLDVNNLDIKDKFKELFLTLSDICSELGISVDYVEQLDFELLENIVMYKSKNDVSVGLKEQLKKICDNKKFYDNFAKMIVGSKFSVVDLLAIDSENNLSISFNGSDYDDKIDEIENLLGDKLEILSIMKELYDMIFLKKLFRGNSCTSLSSLMVERYKQHEVDLRLLKDILNGNRKRYDEFFRTKGSNICIYDKYIHNSISYEELKKEIEKIIPDLLEFETNRELIDRYNKAEFRIANDEFLPRITDSENGKYPYQLNKSELISIIENQGKYYPFLLNKVDNTNTYKCVRILEFRIPYFVGPLNKNSKFSWLVKKEENVKITPYNFDDVIDKQTTAEEFILRMISHCTYLLNEPALPNNSILYNKFKVMNELKQIRINGDLIKNDIQQKIIKDLFMKCNGSITEKKFRDYIYSSSDFSMYNGDINITGYSADGKFANNMQSYVDFFGENGIFVGTSYNESDADEIIRWITIFDDKDILESKVRNKYLELNDNQIKKIVSKKYSGWGKLSEKLLTTKYYIDKETGIKKSILDLMEESKDNFMQIINNDEYKFQDMIKENNSISNDSKLSYKLVDELATSPSTKRGIYQALKVVDEIIDYMGNPPEKVVIEMARENEKNKSRKDDKKKYLQELYKKSKNSIEEYESLSKQLDNLEKIDSEKLFLYFIQEGKCLYSGKPLNIEDLNSYEVDHILPRTLIKDDSLDNKALVYRECNQNKGASLVLPSEYRTNFMKSWWKHLLDIKLISSTKLYRLTRDSYKDEDIEGFINRQLVETRQITKHVANIISNLYDTKVIYLKANLSHNYRERYELYKFRELNDYHHAFDAYLAAVLGEYKDKYIKPNKINYEKIKELNYKLIEDKDYKKLNYGFVINSLDNKFSCIVNNILNNLVDEDTGEILFDVNRFNKVIEDTYYRNDILISKKTEIRNGEFYNQTKSKKGGKGVPLKANMPTEMYGSYTSLNPSYGIFVRYIKNDKELQRIIGIPYYIVKMNNEELEENYIRNLLSLTEKDTYRFVSQPIPFYTEMNWNGQICSLVGATDKVEVCNALEFVVEKNDMKKYKNMLDRLLNGHKKALDDICYENYLDQFIEFIYEKISKTYNLYSNLSNELRDIIDNNSNCSLENKEKLIIQLLSLLKCDSKCANLKFLNSSYSMAFGKKHSRIIENAILINKSVTGIKISHKEIDPIEEVNEI